MALLGVLAASVGTSVAIYTGILQPYTVNRTKNEVQAAINESIMRHEVLGGHTNYMTLERGRSIEKQLERIETKLDRVIAGEGR